MLSIPVVIGVQTGDIKNALDDLERGVNDALSKLIRKDNKITVEYFFDSNGNEVRRELDAVAAANRRVENERRRSIGGEKGSIGRAKAYIKQLERQRQEIKANTKEFYQLGASLFKAKADLRSLQGVQEGSTAALREQRADLIKLRDGVKRSSDQYRILTQRIAELDRQLGKSTPKVEKQFKLFSLAGKIAVAGAAFNSLSAAVRSVGNAASVYTQRQKEIEAFDLALKNVGFTQGQVSVTFNKAADIAGRLGAPLRQVEGLYKRMVPALQAVGASSEETDKFIEGISARTQTLGLSTEQSGRYLEAFAQVLSKGKLQAEELNQQISELDGSFRVQLADALNVTTQELNEMISRSEITADVFVDAVNRMANGTEELVKRVKEGRATIQQLQNLIEIIDTKNIENIGKALEPTIKSFLNIRLSFANFIKEFQKTKVFEVLVKIVNNTSKGLENFVFQILKLAEVLTNLLSPFASVIGVFADLDSFLGGGITQVLAYIATFALLSKGFSKLGGTFKDVTFRLNTFGDSFKKQLNTIKTTTTGVKRFRDTLMLLGKETGKTVLGLTGLRKAFFRSAGSAKVAGKEVQTFSFSAKKAAVNIRKFGRNLRKDLAGGLLALFNPITGAIALFTALADAIVQVFQAYGKGASAFDEYFRLVKEVNEENGNLVASNKKVAGSVEEEAGRVVAANNFQGASWAALASGVLVAGGALAFTIATAGAGTPALIAAGAALAGTAAAATKSGEAFARARNLSGFTDKMKEAAKVSDELASKIKGVNEIEDLRNGDLAEQISLTDGFIRTEKERAAQIEERIRSLKEEGSQNDALVESLQEELKSVQGGIQGYTALKNIQEDALATNIAFTNSSDKQTASVEVLAAALKKQQDAIDIGALQAQTAAIEKFGQSQADAGKLTAANLGVEIARSEQLVEASEKYIIELQRRQSVNRTVNLEEKKALEDLTKTVAQERQKQAQLQAQVKLAIVDAFEAGIKKAQELGDVYGNISNNLKGAFDQVTSSLSGGIQSAVGLIDTVVETEIRGLEKGDRKRKRIILRQLKAQATAIRIEDSIAQSKLRVQTLIAKSEARIAQFRLQAEARIAEARGETKLAAGLREAAQFQNLIVDSIEYSFEIESKRLEIERQRKEQMLVNKGLEEGIGRSATRTANAIGVQNTSLKESEAQLKSMEEKGDKLATRIEDGAEKMQSFKEDANRTSVEEGEETARGTAEALEAAKEYAKELGGNFEDTLVRMADAEASAARMESHLKNSVEFANKLASTITSGNPARAMGGPVESGRSYLVNDGGGREGFLSNSGKFSMLPAARNINWTAPSSGTVIPANLVNQYRNALAGQEVKVSGASIKTSDARANSLSASLDSGNLIQRMAAVMGASGGDQRITNHVTIQSQEPVTDASKIMTNVARMRLRRGGNI
jgi:tape measure domain-containing protein